MQRRSLSIAGSIAVAAIVAWLGLRGPRRAPTAPEPPREEAVHSPSEREALAAPARLRKPTPPKKVGVDEGEESDGDGEATDVPAPTVFRFRVINVKDGTPVAGASIDRVDGATIGTSDAQGRLEVELVSTQVLSVHVHKEGFLAWRSAPFGDRTGKPPTEDDPRTEFVDLEPGAPVDGRVVLANGDPVASTWVFADWRGNVFGGEGTTSDCCAARTDDRGRFHFEGLRLRWDISIDVAPAGRVRLDRSLYLEGPKTDLVLTIPDAGVVEGVVRDVEGRPSAGRVVWLVESDGSAPSLEYVEGVLAARAPAQQPQASWAITAADGTYSIAALPSEGTFMPVVRISEALSARGDPVSFVASGARQTRDIRLLRGGTVRVTLTGVTKASTEDARVTISSDGEFTELVADEASTEPTWLSPPQSPGRYDVRVELPDRPDLSAEITIVEGKTVECRVAVPSSVPVAGIVTDDRNQPIAGATIDWSASGAGSSRGETDVSGRFRMEVWPGRPGLLQVRASSFRGREFIDSRIPDVAPGSKDLRVILPTAPRLTGTFGGWPPHAASVSVSVLAASGGGSNSGIQVESDGRFSIAVPYVQTPVLVRLGVRDFAPVVLSFDSLAAGEVRDLGIVPFVAGRELAIVVHDESGHPLAGANATLVEVRASQSEGLTARSNAVGVARIEHAPLGPVIVRVTAEGYPPHYAVLPDVSSREPQVATLGPGGRIDGRLLDAAGKPMSFQWVSLVPIRPGAPRSIRDASIDGARVDAEGRFQFFVGPGAYRLDVEGEVLATYAPIEVRVGGVAPIELRVK